jgi:hypothetical protein
VTDAQQAELALLATRYRDLIATVDFEGSDYDFVEAIYGLNERVDELTAPVSP